MVTDPVRKTVLIPARLLDAAQERIDAGLYGNPSEVIRAALEQFTRQPEPDAHKRLLTRALTAERLAADLRAENARLLGREADADGKAVTPIPPGTDREQAFITYLEQATARFPARSKEAAEVSGYHPSVARDMMNHLAGAGYLTRADRGFVPVPGMDIREGLPAVRAARAKARRDARIAAAAAQAPDGGPAAPVPHVTPRKAPAARSGAGKGKSAATRARKGAAPAVSRPRVAARKTRAAAAVQAVQDAGYDLKSASELSAVFKPGPAADCLHDNLRGVKGVCPDCMQWVGGKR